MRNKKNILFLLFGIILFLSYTTNCFKINDSDLFHGFERQPEGLVIGRLVRAQQHGIFSESGLTGLNYNKQDELEENTYGSTQAKQHDYYLVGKNIPNHFYAYKSQTGGHAIAMAMVGKILPINNNYKLMIYRATNALLLVCMFLLFALWVARNFGYITSSLSLIFIFLSPLINVYAHSLWWVLFNFYLPFITMLYILSIAKNKSSTKRLTYALSLAFATTFLKCFFSGFEFITTSIITTFVPVVYYFYLERKSFLEFVLFSLKLSVVIICAVFTEMFLLITQIKYLDGTWIDGINHIVHSFNKRSIDEHVSLIAVLKMYLKGNAFDIYFLPWKQNIYYGFLIIISLAIALISYKYEASRKLKALILSFIFSLLAPLSWFVIFKQHAWEHPHMDYIVWYLPTMLYAFVIISYGINIVIKKLGLTSKLA